MENVAKKSNLKWWILLTVIVGTFLGRLDQTIVSLATNRIIDDFGITVAAAGWISTAYILANAVFVPVWGKLGDTIGRKKVYILGFSIFIVGSVLAGLSWDLTSLIFFRIIQAIAGSADYPTAMAILTVTFKEGKERSQALGIWSAAFAASAVFGPLIGGPLIDMFGWRSVFMINLPIGIIGLIMAMTFINESVSEQKNNHFDWWGAITLGISLTSLVLVLDRGFDWGWFSVNSMLCYMITVMFGLIFIKIEKNAADPIIDLSFFKNNTFVSALANNFIVFLVLIGCIFLVPIFAQMFLGYNATQTGFLFIPMALTMLVAAPIGATYLSSPKMKPGLVIGFSTLIAAFGFYLLSFIDARSTALDIIIPMVIMAFGMGLGMAQRTTIISSSAPQEKIGIASSVLALVRNISGAFGIAIFNTILSNNIKSNVLNLSQSSVFNGTSLLDYKTFIGLIELKAQIEAYSYVFIIGSIILLFGAMLALFIKKEAK